MVRFQFFFTFSLIATEEKGASREDTGDEGLRRIRSKKARGLDTTSPSTPVSNRSISVSFHVRLEATINRSQPVCVGSLVKLADIQKLQEKCSNQFIDQAWNCQCCVNWSNRGTVHQRESQSKAVWLYNSIDFIRTGNFLKTICNLCPQLPRVLPVSQAICFPQLSHTIGRG